MGKDESDLRLGKTLESLLSQSGEPVLESIAEYVELDFKNQRRVLSYDEYLQMFRKHPARYCRDAASYLLDMIHHYGSVSLEAPLGKRIRYKLFDQAFLPEAEAQSVCLIGQEDVQERIVSYLENFRREGRPNRVLLMHGPNGSAKSTIASCLMGGLEDYSLLDDGALYRFHWVFPKKASVKGAIGFGGEDRRSKADLSSFAHLPDEELETRLVVEVRDHPLFLLPRVPRLKLIEASLPGGSAVPRWITHGTLCQKNQQIFTALLNSYSGSLREVLRHVRVERYFISRRYRVGAVTLGPELSVDASERQVTADRNWGALPASLQGLSLYDASGELVDAAGGVLELSDLLKRPIDAFKYLQITAETGQVSLGSQNLEVNCVMLASGNELHLSAFREHPEFESFRGRFELITVPYLRDFRQELALYDQQIARRLNVYVAPHATELAARFAVLTRLRKPEHEHYPEQLRPLAQAITAWQKMMAYAGEISELEVKGEKVPLRQAVIDMGAEWAESHHYEGMMGVSARLMRTLIFSAAQNSHYGYLSPFGVLTELDRLSEKGRDFAFLNMEPQAGGYHDHKAFRKQLRAWLLDTFEDELRQASGLVDESRYEELFGRYVSHVSASVKGEKLRNPITGAVEPPDESLMSEVEKLLGATSNVGEARAGLMGRIAAWAIDNPGKKIAQSPIYRDKLNQIRGAVFNERRAALGQLCEKIMALDDESAPPRDPALAMAVEQLKQRFGYSLRAARDTAAQLWADRYRVSQH